MVTRANTAIVAMPTPSTKRPGLLLSADQLVCGGAQGRPVSSLDPIHLRRISALRRRRERPRVPAESRPAQGAFGFPDADLAAGQQRADSGRGDVCPLPRARGSLGALVGAV